MSAVATWAEVVALPTVGTPFDVVGVAVDPIALRRARPADVPAIQTLLDAYAARGLLFARPPDLLYRTVREYVVACDETGVVGCAGLRIHNAVSGEVGALAVAEHCHGRGIGRRMVEVLLEEAVALGLERVFALTLQEGFFHRLGFRTVPLEAVPEKIAADRLDGIDRSKHPKATVLLELVNR